jgi:sphingomyelin phosphodiesterase
MKFANLFGLVAVGLPILSSALAVSGTTERSLAAIGKRNTVSDILTEIEDAATCTACEVKDFYLLPIQAC